MSKVKIISTIGPASLSRETLRAMFEAGMNVARLNGSHADPAWHARAIGVIRETLPDVPILLDIPGRKIRTCALTREPAFRIGETVTLTTDPDDRGTDKVPVNYPDLHRDLEPGATLLADDGTLRFTVTEIKGRDIVCRAEVDGVLRSCKGINVPFITLRAPLVTQRDASMVEFAKSQDVDFIGISFVESAEHVGAVRKAAGGRRPRIVSKIENEDGMENLDEVIAATDAIMIDRGDLSVETGPETLVPFQKRIIERTRAAGKPVIVATEMLHSMIKNPFPTKAEVSDITNAVLDGCAAIMLSGETAVGDYPVECVSFMRRIADAATDYHQSAEDASERARADRVASAMDDAIALICRRLPITKIVAVTISGYAARMIAARQPKQPILAVTNDPQAYRSFNLLPGTEGIHVDIPFSRTSTDHIALCLEELWRRGKLDDDDLVLVTAVGYPFSGNRMNLVQTHRVHHLARTLAWCRQDREVAYG